ncbi:Concanavalin A-like lectin/glucanase domain [Phytophthora cactorum]|nr:Concanavalin A-like lectin/glucanase domain [Phytophthora cactorum]
MAALSWRSLPDEVLVAIRKLYIPRLSHVRYERGSTCVRESDLELIHRSADSKRQYALESSLRFGGQPVGLQAKRLPQSYAPVFRSTDTLFGLYAREAAPSFTLDAWFSLSPVEQGVCRVKSVGRKEVDGLHVNAERNLYCSVTAEKPCVAIELEFGRWYHVALVFEQRFQKVYLDGALVDSQHDQEQQLESFLYYYAQVGTGFVSDDAYNGWYMYGFYGVVDDLRVWHEAMSSEQIAALSRDGAAVLVRPTFSLKRDVPAWMAYGVEKSHRRPRVVDMIK